MMDPIEDLLAWQRYSYGLEYPLTLALGHTSMKANIFDNDKKRPKIYIRRW